MNNKKIKWIIAREGLILLGIVLLLYVIARLDSFLFNRYIRQLSDAIGNCSGPGGPLKYWERVLYRMSRLSWFTVIFSYSFYLLIRFIIWSLRKLRKI